MKGSIHRAARRSWLRGGVAWALALLAGGGEERARAASSEPIGQPPRPGPESFMARAFALRTAAEAAGDQPYGAVVVLAGRIVGEAPSRTVTASDPTAHAEIEAIRDAARRLGRRSLAGCVIYASSQPCPMCQAAARWAGIERYYFGREISDGGAPRYPGC